MSGLFAFLSFIATDPVPLIIASVSCFLAALALFSTLRLARDNAALRRLVGERYLDGYTAGRMLATKQASERLDLEAECAMGRHRLERVYDVRNHMHVFRCANCLRAARVSTLELARAYDPANVLREEITRVFGPRTLEAHEPLPPLT